MQFPVNLVTFTEEILNGKLHYLCSGCSLNYDLCFNDSVQSEIHSC